LFYSAFSGNEFSDAPGWVTINQQTSGMFTACKDVRIFGGYRVFGNKSSAVLYLELPPHYSVRVKFTMYKIDSWDNEQFLVYGDGLEVFAKQFAITENSNICGVDSWKDAMDYIDVTFPHNSPNLQILITTTLNQDASDESWGIRDFFVFIEKCPAGCTLCN
jgi:hypothetical protein